ncbi:hypothetical protein [Psittacicella melopsittaci]|uniref:hypothetical protein n=1 Tax=Psittacicella melopsittaci TaxID=2028576 RepID=UPI001CA74C20|nr:hypothetical protein [Psittacicella melopsittaci]
MKRKKKNKNEAREKTRMKQEKKNNNNARKHTYKVKTLAQKIKTKKASLLSQTSPEYCINYLMINIVGY